MGIQIYCRMCAFMKNPHESQMKSLLKFCRLIPVYLGVWTPQSIRNTDWGADW